MKSAKRAAGSEPTTASAFATRFDVAFTSSRAAGVPAFVGDTDGT
jgi:hypothetical protein